MRDTPAISVVIPTHDRVALLGRTLASLARQSVPPDAYEVIVVCDGCRDGTEETLRGVATPHALVVCSQPRAGAAAARNRGAARARASLLLFLDDDMEATSRLLAAHLDAQAGIAGGGIVLGSLPTVTDGPPDDVLDVEARLWWTTRMRRWSDPGHRFTARDVFSGNVSVPRPAFELVGGFDEAFVNRAGEDHELGIRLLARRTPIRFARDAAARHHDRPTVARIVARAAAEGRGDVVIARRHPDVLPALPLGRPVKGRLARPLWSLGWRAPWLVQLLVATLHTVVMPVAARARFRKIRGRVLEHLRREAYWRGVREELGSPARLDELLARRAAPAACVRDFDLDRGVAALEPFLAEEATDGLRLAWRDRSLGLLSPVPAAEPLRAAHVRAALGDELAGAALAALTVAR